MSQVLQNFTIVREKIAKAAQASDREPDDVHLVAVSKRQPAERIDEALKAGQRLFGENRVQEAQAHWGDIKGQYPDLRLHLIGPLQTNKVKEAVVLFDCIETLDRPKLAEKLAAEMAVQNRDLPCFIEVNTGEEPQKSGVHPAALAEFFDFCKMDCGLDVCGLMCIPPQDEPAALHFAFLKKLADGLGLPELSMGMSADYEQAIPLGATYVRVGTALFGNRAEN